MHKPVKLSITLETLTPIHIGCDDYFQPTEFVIDTTEKVLIKFSIYDLIPLLNDKERAELERISEAREVIGLVRLYLDSSMISKLLKVSITYDRHQR